MGTSRQSIVWGIAIVTGFTSMNLLAQERNATKVLFEPTSRVVLKNDLLQTIRGEMKSFSEEGALVIDDRNRFRKPDGELHSLNSIESLSLLDANLTFTKGEIVDEFIEKLLKAEGVSIANRADFAPPEPSPSQADGSPDSPAVDSTMPASENGTKVTILCANCMKEVALTADVGQKCPHCGIEWDTAPLSEAEVKRLQAQEKAMLNGSTVVHGVDGRPVPAGQNNVVQNAGPRPNVAPAPLTMTTPPEPMNMANIPLWMKVSVFFVCLGVMYYAFFYVR